jgi:hypothetical protein
LRLGTWANASPATAATATVMAAPAASREARGEPGVGRVRIRR